MNGLIIAIVVIILIAIAFYFFGYKPKPPPPNAIVVRVEEKTDEYVLTWTAPTGWTGPYTVAWGSTRDGVDEYIETTVKTFTVKKNAGCGTRFYKVTNGQVISLPVELKMTNVAPQTPSGLKLM